MNDINITKYVASKIKYYREKKNITQKELAEAINTTQQSIARYENGERKADQNILFALADYFNISINDFFPDTNRKHQEEEYKKILRDKGLMDENENIDKDKIDDLLKIAEMMKKLNDKEKNDKELI